jgi:hypothetical protein
MISVPSNDPQAAIRILSSVARFATLPETMGMREWLKAEMERLDAANRREVNPVDLRQRQGACQVIEDIFRIADEADRTIEKIRANQRKP